MPVLRTTVVLQVLTVAMFVASHEVIASESSLTANGSMDLNTRRLMHREFSDSIIGRVVDSAGEPIVGATVTVPEARITTLTDSKGSFSLLVPSRSGTLVIRRFGYATAIRKINGGDGIAGVSTYNFTLALSPFDIAPVTVSATIAPSDALHSVLATSMLTSDALRQDEGISVGHAVSHLPGVRNVSTGHAIGKPMIRGLFGPRVLVLQDGSRLEDYSWSEEDGPSVDARLADRIEVIRGPASVLYGSDAVGGVVNIIPEALPSAVDGHSIRRATLEAYGGTNNTELGSALKVEGAGGRLGWRLFGVGRYAGNYHTPAGEQERTGFFAINGEGALAFRASRSVTTLRFSQYGGEFKLIEAGNPNLVPTPGATTKEAGPDRKLLDNRIQLTHDFFASERIRIEAKGQWQRHSLIEVSDDACLIGVGTAGCGVSSSSGSSSGAKKEQPAFDLLLNTGTLDLSVHHVLTPWLRGTVGVSGMYQPNDSRGPIFLIPSGTTSSGAGFLFEEATRGRLTLSAGGRVDSRRISTDANAALNHVAQTRSWTESTGDIGVIFRPVAAIAVVANLGSAWRAPTFFDLYANGPHLAESRYEIGLATMVPEHAVNTDLAIRLQAGRVRAEVAGFMNNISDFIYTSPTQEQQGGLPVFRHVQTDARLRGGEASLEAHIFEPLTAHAGYEFVNGVITDTDSPLPLMPPPRTTVGFEWRFSHTGSLAHPHVGAELEATARQTRLNENDFATGGYSLINLDAGATFALGHRDLSVGLAVHNVADTRYKNFLSRYKEFAFEPGRNIVIRASTTLF